VRARDGESHLHGGYRIFHLHSLLIVQYNDRRLTWAIRGCVARWQGHWGMALNHLRWSHCYIGMIDAFYVRAGQDMYRGEGSERCLKSWMLGNQESDDQKFRGNLPALIYLWFLYHCPQRRSILVRPTRDCLLRKLIPLSPGLTSGLRVIA
jgi:hypothetical protein